MKAVLHALLLLAGCADTPVSAPVDGPTIVSLNPCADAILAEVAAPGQLLAVSHYSHDPASTSMPLQQALAYPATGGTVEEVLALDPDVVVAGSFLSPATRSALEELGVQVETLGIASSVEQSAAQVRQLAQLAGNVGAGEELIAQIEQARSASAHDDPPVAALMWQDGGIVPGPESLIAQLMEYSGFTLHSAARGLGQGAYVPLEQVLADPPALILASSDERMLTHPVLSDLSDTQYAVFDPALLYCGGPSIIRTLERLVEIGEGLE